MISYRSTDEAGNTEETKRAKIKIDRTAPTVRIGFDLDMREIVVSGSDALSDVTIERDESDISPSKNFFWGFLSRNNGTRFRIHTTVTDEAGHVTKVAFTEERRYGVSFALSDFSIGQGGYAVDASGASASYQALPGKWGREYAFLSGFLGTAREVTLSRYFGWKDRTWVISLFEGEMTEKGWLDGIIVPMLEVGGNDIRIISE
jgi:hypothetical protein